MGESSEQRVRRLIYQSCYTGTRETDTLLCQFARDVLPQLDDDGLNSYEDLLALGDGVIWEIISGQRQQPANFDTKALDMLMAHIASRTKE
ncbi:MAG: succinate dehydrogenase assembly factor 2 [Alphaproteobacteria bacterium]|nr:succinate dehydrogenase assembly factor 2 [Alphaproteobacteria bacterium]